MTDLILSKSSSESDLKRYFTAVLELSKSDNKFPINLDDVWPLVYSRKDSAVSALRKGFIEGEDFITQKPDYQGFHQNMEASFDYSTVIYHLSVPCLEYFIAKKVRPVFEVYRQVFHKTATTLASYQIEDPIERAKRWIEEQERMKMLEADNQQQQVIIEHQEERIEQQDFELKQAAPKVNYYDETLQSTNTLTTMQVATVLGMSAHELNSQLLKIGYHQKKSGQYFPNKPYRLWGLHAVRTTTYTRSDGSIGTNSYTVFTERGKRFIVALYQNDWNLDAASSIINPDCYNLPSLLENIDTKF